MVYDRKDAATLVGDYTCMFGEKVLTMFKRHMWLHLGFRVPFKSLVYVWPRGLGLAHRKKSPLGA